MKLKLTRDIIPTREMMYDADWTEAVFQGKLERFVAELSGHSWHARISIYSAKGWPDLSIWFPATPERRGGFIMAELKDATGLITDAQADTITSLRVSGITVFVWHPRHYPQACDVIQRLAGIEPPVAALPIDGELPLDQWLGPVPKRKAPR